MCFQTDINADLVTFSWAVGDGEKLQSAGYVEEAGTTNPRTNRLNPSHHMRASCDLTPKVGMHLTRETLGVTTGSLPSLDRSIPDVT